MRLEYHFSFTVTVKVPAGASTRRVSPSWRLPAKMVRATAFSTWLSM